MLATRPSAAAVRLVLLALLLAGLAAAFLWSGPGPAEAQGDDRQPHSQQTILVSNLGLGQSEAQDVDKQYAVGFRLGRHGQGYAISGVTLDLDAKPSSLTVSLWIGSHPEHPNAQSTHAGTKQFDFTNPDDLKAGLNRFTAPAGAFAYPRVQYYIVLTNLEEEDEPPLKIRVTTSDHEDESGLPDAIILDKARVRALASTGPWRTGSGTPERTKVLRFAVEGSKRDKGILASSFGQPWYGVKEETVSSGSVCCFAMTVGSADRYLIRGLALLSDDTTEHNGWFGLPFELTSNEAKADADTFFDLTFASAKGGALPGGLAGPAGIAQWEAPQGATVAGGDTYRFFMDIKSIAGDTAGTRGGVTGAKVRGFPDIESDHVLTTVFDYPTNGGGFTTYGDDLGTSVVVPFMAIDGEPLDAMVGNVGVSTSGSLTLGGNAIVDDFVTQGFSTGGHQTGYVLQGIGVEVNGSDDSNGDPQVPGDPDDVSVALFTNSNGRPGTKLFDLISPGHFVPGSGHSYFEAPADTTLDRNETYILVWEHKNGIAHNLKRATGNGEDSGRLGGFRIADQYYTGPDLNDLTASGSGSSLKIAVYGCPANGPVRGRPAVITSDETRGWLQADLSELADPDGLSNFSYQWLRAGSGGSDDIEIGVDAPNYRLTAADRNKDIKVRVSYKDRRNFYEEATSPNYGRIQRSEIIPRPRSTLISNIGQPQKTDEVTRETTDTDVDKQYAVGFRLGRHGQGYDISSVLLDLAKKPTKVNVSLWISDSRNKHGDIPRQKLFDFINPSSFKVGLNRFTAPDGAFAYPNINYYIVLTGLGDSLKIRETSSDHEDDGGETNARIHNSSLTRALGAAGVWNDQRHPHLDGTTSKRTGLDNTTRGDVLRFAVEGSRRDRGMVFSTYGHPWSGDQEVISVGDRCCFVLTLGPADRYLIRRFTHSADNSTSRHGTFAWPLNVTTDPEPSGHVPAGTVFSMPYSFPRPRFPVLNPVGIAGIQEWTAPQGATLAGSETYSIHMHIFEETESIRGGVVLGRVNGVPELGVSPYFDTSTPPGVSISTSQWFDVEIPQLFSSLDGEPLHLIVSNLGQDDDGFIQLGGSNRKVASNVFTTGASANGYTLQGIGVRIEGSDNSDGVAQLPDLADSVSLAVHAAESDLTPGDKLFNLISPDEYSTGHNFFEAPPGTTLQPDTDYALVWTHLSGPGHRLRATSSDDEDDGALAGFDIDDVAFLGADVGAAAEDSNVQKGLRFALYGSTHAAGRPTILSSAELKGWLQADVSSLSDLDGLPSSRDFSYQWIRVDGNSSAETEVGGDAPSYRLVKDDVGHKIKVRVSFTDKRGYRESLTSGTHGPIDEDDVLPRLVRKLVSNLGQATNSTAPLHKQYAQGFRLGAHGQGYEISGVTIDLAEVPSSLTVSLWIGSHPEHDHGDFAGTRLFDFDNPSTFQVGLNRFRAPDGAFAYPNINYYIVLTGFGSSLKVRRTDSDAEDERGEPGAVILDVAHERDTGTIGEWARPRFPKKKEENGVESTEYIPFLDGPDERDRVLRLAVHGSQRDRGVLASSFAHPVNHQEIISTGDNCCFQLTVGAADRYLIRGLSLVADGTFNHAGFPGVPAELTDDSDTLYNLIFTTARGVLPYVLTPTGGQFGNRQGRIAWSIGGPAGMSQWAAPQGATVPGDASYTFHMEIESIEGDIGGTTRGGVVLGRIHGREPLTAGYPPYYDAPKPSAVSFADYGDVVSDIPVMAVDGEPLHAMVSNLDQSDDGYEGLHIGQVVTQAFTTGPNSTGYQLQGIVVNIEGSGSPPRIPTGKDGVLVSVYSARSGGNPDEKLFNLVSPDNIAAGEHFFEAPPGATLQANTTYVLVWHHRRGDRFHRLQVTESHSEDSGGSFGFSIADNLRMGSHSDIGGSLSQSVAKPLHIALYGVANGPPEYRVPLDWLHIPSEKVGVDEDGHSVSKPLVGVGDRFRLLFVPFLGCDFDCMVSAFRINAKASDVDEYNELSQEWADAVYNDPIIRKRSDDFRAVVCTKQVDARSNTMMADPVGVPIHLLDGGWEDLPTLVAHTYDQFYSVEMLLYTGLVTLEEVPNDSTMLTSSLTDPVSYATTVGTSDNLRSVTFDTGSDKKLSIVFNTAPDDAIANLEFVIENETFVLAEATVSSATPGTKNKFVWSDTGLGNLKGRTLIVELRGSPLWEINDYGAYSTGNTSRFTQVGNPFWTGCDAYGNPVAGAYMGEDKDTMAMAAVGVRGSAVTDTQRQVGATDEAGEDFRAIARERRLGLWSISPVFVVRP